MNKVIESLDIIDKALIEIDNLIVKYKRPCESYKFWYNWLNNLGLENIKYIREYKDNLTEDQEFNIDYRLFCIENYTSYNFTVNGIMSGTEYLDWYIEGLAEFIEEIYLCLQEG